jgi:hypothetical protein
MRLSFTNIITCIVYIIELLYRNYDNPLFHYMTTGFDRVLLEEVRT